MALFAQPGVSEIASMGHVWKSDMASCLFEWMNGFMAGSYYRLLYTKPASLLTRACEQEFIFLCKISTNVIFFITLVNK